MCGTNWRAISGVRKLLELGRTMTDAVGPPRRAGSRVNCTLSEQVCPQIQRLHRRGYTFCIWHDMDLIAELCDPIIVMAEGRVLTEGPMEAIRRDERVLEAYLGHSGVQETEVSR